MSGTPLNPIGMEDVPAGGLVPPIYDPLVVEINGNLAIAQGWLGREIRVTRPVNALPTASLTLSLASGFLINFSGDPSAPDLRRLEDFGLLDGALVTIRTAREDPETDYVLFEGYATSVTRKADRGGFAAHIECRYVAEDLDFDPRRGFDGSLWRRWKDLDSARVGRVAAKACVFNPDGRPNMALLSPGASPDSISWTRLDGTEISYQRPYFVSPRMRSQRRSWSWAAVLAYWWYWMLRTEDAGSAAQRIDAQNIRDQTLTVGPSAAPRNITLLPCVRDADGQEVDLITYVMTSRDSSGTRLIDVDPDSIIFPDESSGFNACLLGRPSSVSFDGLSPLQALDLLCMRSGLGYVWETVRRDGQTVHGLRFFAPRSDAPRRFLLPSPLYRTDNRAWTEVRGVANVSSLRLSQDYRPIVNRVRRVGAPIRYEITVELSPGWPALPTYLDVDPDNSAAVSLALAALDSNAGTPPWRKTDPAFNGSSGATVWALVGRLWGLNTHGAWSDYARGGLGNHPFRADRGATPTYIGGLRYPYGESFGGQRCHDFRWQRWGELYSGSGDIRDPESYRRGGHSFRPRPFAPPLTSHHPGMPCPAAVEIHFNAGDNTGGHYWQTVAAAVSLSNWDARVYFDAEDLRGEEMRDRGPSGMGFLEAYVRGKLRVRITCGILGDACLESPCIFPLGGGWSVGAPTEGVPHSLSPRPRYATIVRREASLELRDWVQVDREGGGWVQFSGGNSQWEGTTRPVSGRDDRFAEEYAARQSLHGSDRVRQRGAIESPELVFPPAVGDERYRYRPGDMIDRVAAPDGGHAGKHDIDLRAALDDDFAVIAAVEWEFRLGGGADGAPAYCTRYLLETARG